MNQSCYTVTVVLNYAPLLGQGPFSQLFSSGDSLLAIVAKVVMDQTLFSAILNAAAWLSR